MAMRYTVLLPAVVVVLLVAGCGPSAAPGREQQQQEPGAPPTLTATAVATAQPAAPTPAPTATATAMPEKRIPASSPAQAPAAAPEVKPAELPTATPLSAAGAPAEAAPVPPAAVAMTVDELIAQARATFPELEKLLLRPTPSPFDPDRLFVLARETHWDLVFMHGSGDCVAGCLNAEYWYYSAWPDGTITPQGHFSRHFESATNSYREEGARLWGIP